ncbi:MAG: type I-C CRISPR-associated protein Cas5 [Geobacteraceae bacterium GWC2_55_20]|nr:MAG: type I-C CRISPR-associated protein Cas5 [Geobacteraceae bacterium GWC2_55_20]OGU26339.1 MAG: type I-C CRISPR-associated protein Cas5 [Geobacteraceae bacterium GWF2_54_21]HBA72578.1 type I-C CRISPR-associated protein Cas5 [Geobacter sp.]HCE67332.1 type I-C CRISPR-associated protein Cas5 [Geobacter sp.]
MNESATKSRLLRLKVWGENACFTRPEMKVERVSYDVMTPSAARGVLEAILWKPAIRWHVEQIDVLKPIRWESVRRNEVGSVMSPRTPHLFIEDQRQQRAGLFLRDVAYTIHARFEMTEKAGPEDTTIKFQEMFLRRAEKGQSFNQPFLGCREFSAFFEPVFHDQPLPEPIQKSPDLGWMLYDIAHDNRGDKAKNAHFCTGDCRPLFFRASLDNGRLKVPSIDSGEVRG